MCQLHQSTTAQTVPEINPVLVQGVEAFSEHLLQVLNHGALALMVSVGHRTGLFDAIAGRPPSTADEIASISGLQPRYVREWLGAMVTGGVIEHDPARGTFVLPAVHAAALTRTAAPNNIAAFMQYVPLLGSVEDDIVACFRTGGGVPYSSFPRFQEVMADDSGQSVLPAIVDHILPLDEGLIGRLKAGIDVLEIGCGSGLALVNLARAFPNSRFTGLDLSEAGIQRARSEALRHGLTNIRFEVADVAQLDAIGSYDQAFAFDAVHDQARPRDVLRNVRKALRPGGRFLMQDIDASTEVGENIGHPMGTFLYTVSCMHCMTVSLADGGEGLGAMWGRQQALALLEEAGFRNTRIHTLPHDVQNCYYVTGV